MMSPSPLKAPETHCANLNSEFKSPTDANSRRMELKAWRAKRDREKKASTQKQKRTSSFPKKASMQKQKRASSFPHLNGLDS
mmetsp:Transcript_52639/g.63374  ORF Transcript_52639/g.63374 Transcript_52639/m.63374 type:complete len:82 (-) Transcript_52639:59-304(-)